MRSIVARPIERDLAKLKIIVHSMCPGKLSHVSRVRAVSMKTRPRFLVRRVHSSSVEYSPAGNLGAKAAPLTSSKNDLRPLPPSSVDDRYLSFSVYLCVASKSSVADYWVDGELASESRIR